MFIFEDYKKLDKGIRALATMHWANIVQERLKAQNPHQTATILSGKAERNDTGFSNDQSRFWYKKKNGHPVGHERVVNEVEILVPGVQRWLYHPFWQFLNCQDPVQFNKSKNRMLLSLKVEFIRFLFVDDPVLGQVRIEPSKDFLRHLGSLNDLDALTCLLVLTKESILGDNYSLCAEMNAFKMYLRMVTVLRVPYKFVEIYDLIVRRLSSSHVAEERFCDLNSHLFIPLQFLPVEIAELQRWLSLYSKHLEANQLRNVLGHTEKFTVLHNLNHSSFS